MDNNEYTERKNRVRKLESEILDMCMDMNYAETAHIHDIKSKLYQIEADCMAMGEFYQQCGNKEEIDSKYRKVLEAQELAIKQNVENDNRRTEIAEEQVKNQLRGIELQSELQKNADASELKTLKHRETIEKQNQHMLTAMESIAYSLAKIQVRLDNEQDIIGVANPTSINNEVRNEEHLTEKFKRLVAEEINNGDILYYYLHLNDINNIIIGLVTHENNVTFYDEHPIGKLLYKTMKYVVVPVYDSDGNRIGYISDMKFAKRVTPEEVDKFFEKDADDSDKKKLYNKYSHLDDNNDYLKANSAGFIELFYLYNESWRPVASISAYYKVEKHIKSLKDLNICIQPEIDIKLEEDMECLERDENYHKRGIDVYDETHDKIGKIRNGKFYPDVIIPGHESW
jgi:rRNA processing protein Gar1